GQTPSAVKRSPTTKPPPWYHTTSGLRPVVAAGRYTRTGMCPRDVDTRVSQTERTAVHVPVAALSRRKSSRACATVRRCIGGQRTAASSPRKTRTRGSTMVPAVERSLIWHRADAGNPFGAEAARRRRSPPCSDRRADDLAQLTLQH